MNNVYPSNKVKVNAVFISDVHLGFPGCSAKFLLDFLRHVECKKIYLVGDIIDFLYMRKKMYWPQEHNDVIRTILGKAKHGTEVIYVPGNHDEPVRMHEDTVLGNVLVKNEIIHTTIEGKRFLVLHGDQFDSVVKYSPLLALIGSKLYEYLLKANRAVSYIRYQLGLPYWSLAAALKHKVKGAVNYISNFETAVSQMAKQQKVDGMICGHIHRAEIREIDDVLYCNCGDWVESCTALIENKDGSLEILHWTEQYESVKKLATAA
ncbi:MAG: UDP-2,3-diacylglucosamine diphosphatase [Proteobacteria bacterium]|nr:UDP-2,3-diacylglucosamine diphosphatase [Pseudomonadota bacterium]NOG59760.1 UDP-2,3-diacylglucosamine diphosphatase [Pseudomonadota bacterium]